MRWIVPLVLTLVVTLVIAMGSLTPARATVQAESCWEPDIEYPVPCDDDED
jgi:hypothetical protein